MNCSKVKDLLQSHVEESLPEAKRRGVDSHLQDCSQCRRERAQIVALQELIARQSEFDPPPSLKERFNEALLSEIAENDVRESDQRQGGIGSLLAFISFQGFLPYRMAAVALALVGGIAIGYKLQSPGDDAATRAITQLQEDMEAIKAVYLANALSLPRPSQRLQALVAYQPSSFSPAATAAYLQVLREDDNVNIRLAALHILSEYSEREDVRNAFIEILEKEREPIIQVSIIQIFEHSIDDRIFLVLREMILSDETNDYIKGYAMNAIQKIEIEGYAKSKISETL